MRIFIRLDRVLWIGGVRILNDRIILFIPDGEKRWVKELRCNFVCWEINKNFFLCVKYLFDTLKKLKSHDQSMLWIFIQDSLFRYQCPVLRSRGPSAFNSPFGHESHSHNICPLTTTSLVYRYRSQAQPSVLVALHYQSVFARISSYNIIDRIEFSTHVFTKLQRADLWGGCWLV